MLKWIVIAFLLPLCAAAASEQTSVNVKMIVDVCMASNISDAVVKGQALHWHRIIDKEWEDSFIRYNGGTVEVVGWRRGDDERDGLLSFWIANGPSPHRSCSYIGPANGEEILKETTARLGAPLTLETDYIGTFAEWGVNSERVELYQVGTLVSITFLPRI